MEVLFNAYKTMPKLIDTHAHVNFGAFKDDLEEVIKITLKEDCWIINVGSQSSTSKRAVELAEKYKNGVFAAVGIHPSHLIAMEIDEDEVEKINFKSRAEDFDREFYLNLAKSEKVVAIGEAGLDYTYLADLGEKDKKEAIKKQKEVFLAQIRLSKELDIPLIIHSRDTHKDTLEILKKEKNGLKAVMHCFVGDWNMAKKYLDLGLFLSFTGLITFKVKPKLQEKQDKIIETIKNMPIDRLMIETDAPYLTPEPHRGKRNEPLFVRQVAEKIAQIKGLEYEKVAKITTNNAIDFFGLE